MNKLVYGYRMSLEQIKEDLSVLTMFHEMLNDLKEFMYERYGEVILILKKVCKDGPYSCYGRNQLIVNTLKTNVLSFGKEDRSKHSFSFNNGHIEIYSSHK